ncbi:MAG: hypothetical protein ACFCUI_08600 [Bernardetiaceae bacterium]
MKTTLLLFLAVLLAALTIVGCSDGQVFKDFEDVKHFRWEQNDVKTFSVEVKEAGSHRVSLALRHITETPLSTVTMLYTITDPAGNITEKEATLRLRDADTGQLLGEVAYQFTDAAQVVDAQWTPTSTGVYRFSVAHQMPDNPVPTIMEVGLIVEKNE